MVQWLEEMPAEKLMGLELLFKRVEAIKGLISKKEREVKSLDDLFVGSLYIIMGKYRQKAREERSLEIIELNSLLDGLQNNRKVHQHLRNISKFDIPSLRRVERSIAAIVNRNLEQEFKHLFESHVERQTGQPMNTEEWTEKKKKPELENKKKRKGKKKEPK